MRFLIEIDGVFWGDDHKVAINPNERDSAYLSGGSWEITEKE